MARQDTVTRRLRGAKHGRLGLAAGLVLAVWAGPLGAQGPLLPRGQEFQVNTYTTAVQTRPVVGPDGAGGFVVLWASYRSAGTDSSQASIQGQRYSSSGAALGAEFQGNTYTTSNQNQPAVGPDGAGGFVVLWQSYGSAGTDSSNFGIQGQRYSSSGPRWEPSSRSTPTPRAPNAPPRWAWTGPEASSCCGAAPARPGRTARSRASRGSATALPGPRWGPSSRSTPTPPPARTTLR